MRVANYICGEWRDGDGDGTALVDPVSGEEIARASTDGIDLGAALDFARNTGGPQLRELSYAERGALLEADVGPLRDAAQGDFSSFG